VRSHPVVGSFFVLAGLGLLALGAFSPAGRLPSSPLPSEVLLPFVFWQLAAWSLLLGVFFLRPRRRVRALATVRPATR
jgi:hypothetical protein